MGTWGAGSFENDDALDWLSKASTFLGWQEIENFLTSSEEDFASPSFCSELVALCELIAARNGHPDKTMPEEALALLSSFDVPTEKLISLSTNKLHRLLEKSALRNLWQESGELKQWRGQISKLQKRLAMPAKAIVLKPRKPPTIDELGKQAGRQMGLKRFEDALITLDKILAIDSKRVVTHNNRAWCLANLERYELAKAEIELTFELLATSSNVPHAVRAACLGTRAFILLKTKHYEEAVTDLTASLDLNARAINFKHRAEAFEALGKHDDAARDIEQFKLLTIKDHLTKARTLWNDEQFKAAKTELSQALELEPTHILALARRGFTNAQLQLPQEADLDFTKLMDAYGENPYLLFQRAQDRTELKRATDARSDRERCHQLGLDMVAFYDHHVNRQDEIIQSGNVQRIKKEVIPSLNDVLKVVPEHALAHSLKVKALKASGAEPQAEREEARTLETLPVVEKRSDMLGWGDWFWKLMTGEEDQATELLQAWSSKTPAV